jgi:hypothetical protein
VNWRARWRGDRNGIKISRYEKSEITQRDGEGIVRDATTYLGPYLVKGTRVRDRSVPGIFPTYSQSTIPAACAESHTIRADTQAANTVFVASQDTDALSFERVPNIARPIVVSTKQDASRDGEGN